MLLIGLCAAHSAAAIRYARTLESFDLYNFSLSHAWLVFIVAWLGTWTVAEIKRSRAAMTGEGTAPRPRV
jgi:hypothetical protein